MTYSHKNRMVLATLALWACLYIASFLLPPLLPRVGDGFTGGLNRVMTFLSLQFGATILAMVVLFLRPRRGPLHRLATLPIILMGLLLAGFAGLLAWAMLA